MALGRPLVNDVIAVSHGQVVYGLTKIGEATKRKKSETVGGQIEMSSTSIGFVQER